MSAQLEMEAEVAIVGAGITGTSLAWELAKRGKSAIVLDKSGIGQEGSGRNAGGLRAQNRDRKEALLAIGSAEVWGSLQNQIREEIDVDIEYRQGGNIKLISEEGEVDGFLDAVKWEREHGLDVEYLSPSDVHRLVPNISLKLKFYGAKYCPVDGSVNPLLTTPALARMAEKAGAKFLLRSQVESINMKGGVVNSVSTSKFKVHAQCVVIAAGPWTSILLKPLDLDLPLSIRSVPMFVTERVPCILGDEFVIGNQFWVHQTLSGNILFGSRSLPTSDLEKHYTPDLKEFLWISSRVVELFPILADVRVLRSWAGFLDWTYDDIPVIDLISSLGQLYVAAGFCGHGMPIAPIVGRVLAEWICGESLSKDVRDFSFSRLKDHPLLFQDKMVKGV